jgi:hypothetical protein
MSVAHAGFGESAGDSRPPVTDEGSSCAKEASPVLGMNSNVVSLGRGALIEPGRRRQGAGALLKTEQAAEYLAISVRQLQYLSERQEVAVIEMGRNCIRYDRADLDDYIDRRRRPCRKEAPHG